MRRKVCVRDMLGTATLDTVYSLRRREIKNTMAYLYNRVGSPVNVGEQTHVKALLRDMVVGGTDTTSNTVEFAMEEMLNKPEVMRKSQQELDIVIGKTNTLEEPDIHKLPYLKAVFKEVLRLHPVLPLIVPHCPSKSCIIGGYTIPKGARVFIHVWAIHKDPSIVKNPSDFDPGRFLNGEGDYSGNDFNYFPLGREEEFVQE
ncbi:Cytochrome P450 71A1 [Camellia lanceoleosa]|uniref:Cytochrome P450 71A1 n=1 Tax=Camellia lanceoleosa TaxID=1840588 RepID=A0ACC0FNY0_9ERIC|nr:Cytochrome P450 71A1 [Camellia lanceoleosa]